MKIISTNLGHPQTITWQGKTVQTGIFKQPVNKPVFLSKLGVEGDAVMNTKVHGGVDKSCYLYPADHYAFWKQKYPDLDWNWGVFGENLTVAGLAENKMHIGDVLEIGESIVKITQPRIPCYKLGIRFDDQAIIKQFLEAERPGVYVKVLKEGFVKTGDQVFLLERQSNNLTVTQIFNQFTASKRDKYLIDRALEDEDLAASIIKDLKRFRESI